MKIDLEQLRKREEYINCHEKDGLLLWNYSNHCQYDKAWDEYTKMARGLITDSEGNIVARPFPKFFNLGENEESRNLPVEVPVINEKLDGSLGIQYYWGEDIHIATRGSFESEQGLWATEWIRKFKKSEFKEGYTYLYEIIYPENRIVVDYKDRKELVLLAVINNETGEDIGCIQEAQRLGISYPKVCPDDLNYIIENMDKLGSNDEGFVVRYSNGLRIKMKGQEYVRLHRLITGFSTKSIWECLKENQNIDEILEKVPDEFFNWVKEKRTELESKFKEIADSAWHTYTQVMHFPDRKSQAVEIMQSNQKYSGIIFGLLDDKPVDKLIWRMLKPKFELPFKTDI